MTKKKRKKLPLWAFEKMEKLEQQNALLRCQLKLILLSLESPDFWNRSEESVQKDVGALFRLVKD